MQMGVNYNDSLPVMTISLFFSIILVTSLTAYILLTVSMEDHNCLHGTKSISYYGKPPMFTFHTPNT